MGIILRACIRTTVTTAILSGMSLAGGQTVYRCAHLYSDRPCPGAVAIDARDTRTPAQKALADASTQDISRTAERLERERRALERTQLRSAAATRPVPATSTPHSSGGKHAGKAAQAKALQKAPESPFTAIARLPPPAPRTPTKAGGATAPGD